MTDLGNKYYVGDLIRLSITFSDSDGTQIDPDAVTCYHQDPSSNIAELVYGVDTDVIKSDTGAYYVDVSVDESGNWYYRWKGVGTLDAATQGRFHVRELNIST
jgi:hypothetical protein